MECGRSDAHRGYGRRRVLALLAGGLLTAGAAAALPMSRGRAGPASRHAAMAAGGTGTGESGAGKDDGAAWARGFLARHPSIDVHAHPGRFFLEGLSTDHPAVAALGAPRSAGAVADMAQGGIAAAVFALVADLPVLAVENGRIVQARDFRPGEASAVHRHQLAVLKAVIGRSPLLEVGDRAAAEEAFSTHRPGAIVAVEGGDFLEGDPDRVATAAAEGVRIVTLVHYRVNELADNQTAPPVHGGLSPAGRAVVRAMEENGVLLDLAHASERAARQALEIVERPVLLSHSALRREGVAHPRLISPAHARAVAGHGGVIGVVPWGIGQRTRADYVREILRMIEVVGIDHVAIGTDMDATYRPVFAGYRDWPLLVADLHAAGLSEDDLAKLTGGNFLRLWRAWGR